MFTTGTRSKACDPSRSPLVVIGGGAAGLEFVTRFARRRPAAARRDGLVLIDRALSHIWKPRLHEIATAMQNQSSAESSFLAHANTHGYRFEIGALQSIDAAARRVHLEALTGPDGRELLPTRTIGYGQLVLALGSEENDFGTPGAREHCLFLNTPAQAVQIREALLAGAFRLARGQQDALSIAIIGGGATGVELAAEIRDAMDALWRHEPGLERDRVRLTVVEGANRLLAANPQEVSDYAEASLSRRSVALALAERVVAVDANGLALASGRRIDATLKIWTAGIRGPRVLEDSPALPRSVSGRVRIDDRLQCEGVPYIHAMGDCAEWIDPASGRPAPYTAQVASAQARYLARAFALRISGYEPAPFRFATAGAIVSIGESDAAGNLTTRLGRRSRDHFIQGMSAQLVYAALYRRHEFEVHGWRRAMARWVAERLSQSYEPAIKLH
ncbi:NAD(P)/FAD-dependent oxidoreductase [Variovorax sp. RCC_210]|uniref:NAD(P)/FAD-dependent oxidoreductase n=1 Tax=Variovorax sp. RCC_210 TaxID=3239217 RepID=UPI0035253747